MLAYLFWHWPRVEVTEPAYEAQLGQFHRVARAAAGGCAGIYRLRVGEFLPNCPPVRSWFAKPVGVRYEELFSIVGPRIGAQKGAIWQRQMTLGPTPEFCIQASADVLLPGGIDPLVVAASRVWP